MALINRWYTILEALMAQPRVDVATLCQRLAVSTPTLYASIDYLNELLGEGVSIKRYGKQLTLLVSDYGKLEQVISGSLRKESDFNSSHKRSAYLIKRLIQATSPLFIDDLADELGVSRTTITKDLKRVKQRLACYGLSLVGKPNYGLTVIGAEYQLRLCYLHCVYDYFDLDPLQDTTLDCLAHLYQVFKIPRQTQELLTRVVSVTVNRLANHHLIDAPIPYYVNDLRESDMLQEVIYEIETTYQITLSQHEKDFISFPVNTQFISGFPYCLEPSCQVISLYQAIVKRIKDHLLVHFDEKRGFTEMKLHLKFLLNRLIFQVELNDIFHGEIKQKYPLAFEMATVAGEELKATLGLDLASAERGYLALYFEMLLHADASRLASKPRQVAVVCTTGRGTAAMICRQLRRVLGQDITITQYSEEAFNPKSDDDYFAIFTTIPLKLGQLQSPVVHISNLFDDSWLRQAWQEVNHFHQKQLKTLDLAFVRLARADSYRTYVEQMASLLHQRQLVDQAFAERLLEREDKQSTIFDRGIAFPHTLNDGNGKTVLMLGIVEPPLETAQGRVEFIFLVAIPKQLDQKAESDLLELYDAIFRVANDGQLKEALRHLQTEADFKALIQKEGVF